VKYGETVGVDQPHTKEQSHREAHWLAQSKACQVKNGTCHAVKGNGWFILCRLMQGGAKSPRNFGQTPSLFCVCAVFRALVVVQLKVLTFPRY
jgi:hypothetical protein